MDGLQHVQNLGQFVALPADDAARRGAYIQAAQERLSRGDMRTFRAYMLNPAGRIVWADWIEAADLSEAEAKAHALCRDGTPTVELWEGPRRLSDIPCDDTQPTVRTPAGGAG